MNYKYANATYVNRLIKQAMKDEECGRLTREGYARKLRVYANMVEEPNLDHYQLELDGMRETTLEALKAPRTMGE